MRMIVNVADANGVEALLFDVFGTLVDWRSGVAREAKLVLSSRGYALAWTAFADAWRGEYQPSMEEIRSGSAVYSPLDVLHRSSLQKVLAAFGIGDLPATVLDELNLAWHRLDVWPDVSEGLARLKRPYLMAPVSNGNIALMTDLARRNGLCWDAILGADIARDFKPKAAVYAAAAAAFNLKPEQCMMCAAHESDLAAAAAAGMRTAHVARPEEYPGAGANCSRLVVDFACKNILDLAIVLGA